ncbi:hypothetical protein F4860DRAFT_518472 [Xylaria cubensis]|nr:hypothetical protein F4860DRAFT_518472 [Xylaria cubensis]
MFSSISSLLRLRRPESDTGERTRAEAAFRPHGIRILRGPVERHDVNFIFVCDAFPDSDKSWSGDLIENFPSARIFIYEYEIAQPSLAGIVDPQTLTENSLDLLRNLVKICDAMTVPVVFFAHGFGGLLYEEAFVQSYGFGGSRERIHAAFLFGTPHFGAGIAEWAVIVAKLHGFHCAKTAQAQDWSSIKDKISWIATMQRKFREILNDSDSGPATIGCFSTLREPDSDLIIAPEWTVLPEFTPIAINRSHSSMTTLDQSDDALNAIKSIIKQLVESKSIPTLGSSKRLAYEMPLNKADRSEPNPNKPSRPVDPQV